MLSHYKKYKKYYDKYFKKWKIKNKKKYLLYLRNRYKAHRLKSLLTYGGDPPKCKCCNEKKLEFLCIDHIHGGGGKMSKYRRGINIFVWLNREKRKGYRVLCYNCNFSLGIYKYCPHKN